MVRRVVVAPLMPVLAAVALAAFPVVLLGHAVVAVALVAVGRRPVRWRLPRVWLFGVAYLVGETACILACLALWLRFVRTVHGEASRSAHERLLRRFLTALIALAEFTFRFRLQVHEPTSRPQDSARMAGQSPVLVLARHAGPGASFVLVHLLMTRYSRSPRIVLTDRLRWDPAIDVLLTRIGCRFIARGGDEATSAIGGLAASLGPRQALVLFPEGGDWTPTRQRLAVAWLRRRGLAVQAARAEKMVHVLPPRPAGTAAALCAAPSADVVVFSHTGHDELLDLQSVWAALPLRRALDVIWWREPSAPRSGDEEATGEWLYDLWRRIDAWVSEQKDLASLAPDAR